MLELCPSRLQPKPLDSKAKPSVKSALQAAVSFFLAFAWPDAERLSTRLSSRAFNRDVSCSGQSIFGIG